MKYIREVSDIHLDFDVSQFHPKMYVDPGQPRPTCDMDLLWYPEPMEGDDDTCMVLAGDIWLARKMLKRKHLNTKRSWLSMLSDQFKYVVFVLGNHDFWSQNVHTEVSRINEELIDQGIDKKVFLLESSKIILDQVKFIGGSLWTDYDRGNPIVMMRATSTMNDYRYIRTGNQYRKVKSADLASIHNATKRYIFDNAIRDWADQKVVVVTHHAPSYQSISPKYRLGRGVENFFYYSDLDLHIDIASDNIDLWFHGHCHHVSDYTIRDTRVICNPRGYNRYENIPWNPRLRIELSDL